MPLEGQILSFFLASVIATGCFAATATGASVETKTPPDTNEATNDAPNPYRTIEHWAKLPDGRKMGSTSAVDIDKDGVSVWVAERCGANSCLDPQTREIKKMDVIFKLGPNGNVLKSFGSGMFVAPHGIYVDKDDNVWVTDYQDNAPPHQAAAARDAALFNGEAWTLLRVQRLVTRSSNSAPMGSS